MSETIRSIGKAMIFVAGTLVGPLDAASSVEFWAILVGMTALTVGGGMILDLVKP